jgi:HD-like signal output (HDOD) protein/ActR/RegA family two-component response regulator
MKRILFVDDEPKVLDGLRARFYSRRREMEAHFAPDGSKAVDLMRAMHFDVLVTDLRMPVLGGTALVTLARAESPDTIRIVLSGYADEEESNRLLSLAHRYLSKPCEPQRLEECIDRCLATQSLIQSVDLRARLGSLASLPPVPDTFAALQQALSDPTVDSRMIARIVQRDSAVSAKVLQVCNSAFFRLPRRISSIEQAVSYLGLSAVRSMTLSAELFKPGASLSPGLDLGQLQRHALSVGVIARSLAAGKPWADDAFLAGLLHDVGFLLLGRQLKEEFQQALDAASAGMDLSEAEIKHIGVDHETAGGYLLSLWGLSFEIVEVVTHHEKAPAGATVGFDIGSAIAIAHALLTEVRPADIPAQEVRPSRVNDDYLRAIQYPQSWDALLESTHALLASQEAA